MQDDVFGSTGSGTSRTRFVSQRQLYKGASETAELLHKQAMEKMESEMSMHGTIESKGLSTDAGGKPSKKVNYKN